MMYKTYILYLKTFSVKVGLVQLITYKVNIYLFLFFYSLVNLDGMFL